VDATTAPESDDSGAGVTLLERTLPALVIVWSRDQPWRLGECVLIPPGSRELMIGRGAAEAGVAAAIFGQQRPGGFVPAEPLTSPALSRRQLLVKAIDGERIALENVGKSPLFVNGVQVTTTECVAGDELRLGRNLLLLCCQRPERLSGEPPDFPFGHADADGIVGESPAAWELRQRCTAVARSSGHVLVMGQSGAGKELAAQAIHRRSGQRRPLVSRNAATIPESLVDAELFGNAKNYPNAGMSERPGLIGEADGTGLFLDEIAELPHAVQAHLLRVLDSGEYQRLGESKARASRFRLIGATNRPFSQLRSDFAARFSLHVELPGLDQRREDIPLLVRHLLRGAAQIGDELARRCFQGSETEPQVPWEVISSLLHHDYATNVRELRRILWEALSAPSVAPGTRSSTLPPAADDRVEDDGQGQHIQRCLDENNGSIENTWRALGLKNRFALLRLIKKYGLEVRRRPGLGKS
jgi:two-component system, NtrC family, response regulator HydG